MTNRLTRNPRNAWIGGVCSGIARHLGVDPILIRIAFIALLFVGVFPAVVLYILLWVIVPAEY